MKLLIKTEIKHGTKIFIDDKEMERVRKVNFKISAGEVPTVIMEFIPDDIHIDSDHVLAFKGISLDDCSIEELQKIIIKKCTAHALSYTNL